MEFTIVEDGPCYVRCNDLQYLTCDGVIVRQGLIGSTIEEIMERPGSVWFSTKMKAQEAINRYLRETTPAEMEYLDNL
jgi:hypothetical protein